MYEVSVDETFAAAHNLRGYKGKCEDLHTATTIKSASPSPAANVDSVGLLYDFVHLKQIIQTVIRSLDHKYLNELSPFDVLNPSAENLARHIYEETVKQMRPGSQRRRRFQHHRLGDGDDGRHLSALGFARRHDFFPVVARSAFKLASVLRISPMVITEIFKSIQGEGTRAGLPCIFIRLTGCNLRCRWCDTAYAFYGGTESLSVDEVLAKSSRPRIGSGPQEPARLLWLKSPAANRCCRPKRSPSRASFFPLQAIPS